jgi:hypothetical protein
MEGVPVILSNDEPGGKVQNRYLDVNHENRAGLSSG